MTPTPHGQVPAIQRYKIGYHSDEWGVRSSTPGGIPDPSGQWVRYEDHAAVITALRTQQPAPQQEAQGPIGVVEHAQAQTSYIHWTAAPPPNGTKLYTAPQQEAQEPVAISEAIERMAADRYKVVPSHESMFHRWAVVAGTGTQQLYLGREVECQNMARKFAGAFLDGAFVALQQAAPQPAPAPLSDDTERLEWLLRKLPGDALRYVVGELADTSSGAEFRAAIDAALAAQGVSNAKLIAY